jgi:hypothetical protein
VDQHGAAAVHEGSVYCYYRLSIALSIIMPGVWGCFQSVYYFNNWNLEKYILYYTTRYNRNKIGIFNWEAC